MPNITAYFLSRTLDTVEALLLLVSYVLLSPFSLMRWPGKLVNFVTCYSVLSDHALVAKTMRCSVESKLGRWDRAAACLEGVIAQLEGHLANTTKKEQYEATLKMLYGLVCQDYLRGGHIDDCSQAIIRAHKSLGIEKLAELPDFDVRSAQIVKAGLAAGKLLGDSGMATLMVTTDGSDPIPLKRSASRQRKKQFPAKLKKDLSEPSEAKIIPFPSRDDIHT